MSDDEASGDLSTSGKKYKTNEKDRLLGNNEISNGCCAKLFPLGFGSNLKEILQVAWPVVSNEEPPSSVIGRDTVKLHYHYIIWWLVSQKQVSMAWTCNYIPQILWDVIACPCHWHLLLARKFSYVGWGLCWRRDSYRQIHISETKSWYAIITVTQEQSR